MFHCFIIIPILVIIISLIKVDREIQKIKIYGSSRVTGLPVYRPVGQSVDLVGQSVDWYVLLMAVEEPTMVNATRQSGWVEAVPIYGLAYRSVDWQANP